MAQLHIHEIARSGTMLPVGSGVSDTYAGYINQHWQLAGRGQILKVLLATRLQGAWQQLGQQLTSSLQSLGKYVGLSLDGTYRASAMVSWIHSLVNTPVKRQLERLWHTFRARMSAISHTLSSRLCA